ncbi:VTT domain-containing protein [soil metagenome]
MSFNLSGFLEGLGPWALLVMAAFLIIETGLLFPFLPGDSLIFSVALLAPALNVPLWLVILVAAAAAITGDQIGFEIGRRRGRRLFQPDARIFKTRYLDEADRFFARWGRGAIVLARFVPIVRTFIAPAIGASTLRHRTFTIWNALGGILWATLLGLAGFFLGQIPAVADNVELIGVGIVVISVVPIVIAALARRRRIASESSTHRP